MNKELIQKLEIADKLKVCTLEKDYILKVKTTIDEKNFEDDFYIPFLFPEGWYEWDSDIEKIKVLNYAISNNKNIKHFFEIPNEKQNQFNKK